MAQYTGNLSTSQEINESRNIRIVDEEIAYYDPNAAPLITMLNRIGRRKAIKSTHFEFYEQDYNARWASSSAAYTNETAITVDDGTKFVASDTFVPAPLTGSYIKPELIRVVSIAGNVLTVSRNVGGGAIGNIALGQDLRITGSMFEEFAPFPTQKRSIPVRKEGYLQITRTPTSFSNTAIATAFYGTPGSERERAHIQDMVEHKCKLNSTLIWGRTSQSLSGGPNGYPIRSSPGLFDTITTNVLDAGGTLTWKKFTEFSRMSFRYGPKDKILVASPILMEAISNWGFSKLLLKPEDTKIGLNIVNVTTAHGNWKMVRDWMLENGPSGTYGFGGLGISLDLDQIWYLYLANNGVNRDTKVYLDAIKDGADGKRDEILTEFAFKIKMEKFHSILTNVTDYII